MPNPTSQTLIDQATDLVVEHGKTGGLVALVGALMGRMLVTVRRGARVEESVRQLEKRVNALAKQVEADALERQQFMAELRAGQQRVLSELSLARAQVEQNAERTDERLNLIDQRHSELTQTLLMQRRS